MPILSMFYGIIVRMYSEPRGKHNAPHIHVQYQDKVAVYSLEGVVLEGEMLTKQHRMILAWIAIHEDELYANWELLCSGQEYYKITPLE